MYRPRRLQEGPARSSATRVDRCSVPKRRQDGENRGESCLDTLRVVGEGAGRAVAAPGAASRNGPPAPTIAPGNNYAAALQRPRARAPTDGREQPGAPPRRRLVSQKKVAWAKRPWRRCARMGPVTVGCRKPGACDGWSETGHSPRAVACSSASPDDSTLNLPARPMSPALPARRRTILSNVRFC